MPFLDRYWWLRPVLAVAGLLYVSQPMKGLYDDGYLSDVVRMPSDHIGDILYFGLCYLFFLVLALLVAASAFPARRRKLRRLAALGSNPEAIPRALVVYPNVDFDLAEKPIIIEEQFSKDTKWLFILVAFPFLLICLAAIIAFEVVFCCRYSIRLECEQIHIRQCPASAGSWSDLARQPSGALSSSAITCQ
jgi:hypothetical protein